MLLVIELFYDVKSRPKVNAVKYLWRSHKGCTGECSEGEASSLTNGAISEIDGIALAGKAVGLAGPP